MKTTDFQHNFENVVSFDDGETVEVVTVAYDYLPEDDQYAEVYDLFVFDANGKDITYDIPRDETDRLLEETKIDHQRLVAESNEYVGD